MKSLIKLSIVLLILFSCKRENKEFIGPAFISAGDGFIVTNFTATPSPIDFTASSVFFNATFNQSVSWILTIRGQKSGAIYEVKNISSGINNLEWKGSHDGVSFFRNGEIAIATLSFFGSKQTYSINIEITQVPNYKTCGQFPLSSDFEIPSQVLPVPPSTYSPYWASFNFPTPIPNVVQGIDSIAIDYKGNQVPSVQGNNYYFIKGLGNQSNFVSGIQYFSSLIPTLPATPDDVWVNFYLYGSGDPNASVEIEYQEQDFDGNTNGYQGYEDDAFVAYVTLDHKGWKLFSFKYSSLTPSKNSSFGGSGNKKHEPEKLKSFDLILIKKSNPDSPVEVYFDYPIITVGGPFKPCK